jgi:hypothetical protein
MTSLEKREDLEPMNPLKQKTLAYVRERVCESGGFCFYRLEEPNGSDTYYAIEILTLLNEPFQNRKTEDFLKNIQDREGGFKSIYWAYYSLKGLRLMAQFPRISPAPYLKKHLSRYQAVHASSRIRLRRLNYLTDLCMLFEINVSPRLKDEIISFIMSFQNSNGGFGKPVSTLMETTDALGTLQRLGYPVTSLPVTEFLKSCEDLVHGFLNIPAMAPSFLEHLHAGVVATSLLGGTPQYPRACLTFIQACQNKTGGFSRASHGLPSLQNTYFAIHALSLLEVTAG